MTKTELVKAIRAAFNRALPTDPWTDEINEWDEDLRNEDILAEIIDILEPEVLELDKEERK